MKDLVPPLTVVLAAGASAALYAYRPGVHAVGDLTPTVVPTVADPKSDPNAFQPVGPTDYGARLDAALARPLFSETRRPAQSGLVNADPAMEPDDDLLAEVAEEERQEEEPATLPDEPVTEEPEVAHPDLVLRGFMAADDRTQALVSIEGQREVWVSIGDTIDGWNLQHIASDRITLRQGLREAIVKLER
ncbi:MAG: hypothetical protein JKP98_03870 [Rhodobacteraceae bacterium]|nr:hypothetical protein [Paracoccaceae bacterium]MBL4556628.1 hypothetical protein [Paracoccaceae bacterium]